MEDAQREALREAADLLVDAADSVSGYLLFSAAYTKPQAAALPDFWEEHRLLYLELAIEALDEAKAALARRFANPS